jgi:uncharacterized protein Yka (UPF0111/DUF47 family)
MAKVTEEVELKLNDNQLSSELSNVSNIAKQADASFESLQRNLNKSGNAAKGLKEGVGYTKELTDAVENLKNSFQKMHNTEKESARVNTITKMQQQADELKAKLKEVEQAYSSALKSGDSSELRNVASELDNLKAKAQSYADTLRSARYQGIDVKPELSEAYGIRDRISEMGSGVAGALKSNLKTKVAGGITQISSLVRSSISETFNFSKAVVSKYFGLLKTGFSNVFSYIQNKMTGLFSFGKNAFGGMGSMLSQLKGLLGVVGLGYVTKSMYSLANTAINMEGTMSNVFGNMDEDIRAWSNEYASRFTLTIENARSFATEFGGILQNLDITGKPQAEMAKNLTALSGDIASYYGMAIADSSKMVEQALVGNVRAFKSLGIVMNTATLNEFALSRGYAQTYSQMNATNQAILRYNYLLAQTTSMQGNASASAGGWTNQIRLLKENFRSLGSLLGGALIKALYPVVVVLNTIVASAVNAGNALAKFLGFDTISISKQLGSSGGGLAAIPEGIGDTTDALGKESKAYDKAGKSAKKAGKAAKNAADNLQGFDKLNNLTSDKSSGAGAGGSGGGGIGGGGAGIGGLIDFDSYYKNAKKLPKTPLQKWLDKLWDLLSDKKWKAAGKYIASGINNLVNKIYNKLKNPKLYQSIDKFSDAITDFVDGLLDINTFNIGRTFGAGINLISHSINQLYKDAVKKDILRKTGQRIAEFFLGLSNEVNFKQLGSSFATGLRTSIDVAAGFVETAEATKLGNKLGRNVRDFISGAVDRVLGGGKGNNKGAEKIGKIIAGFLNQSASFAGSLFDPKDKTFDKLCSGLVTTINTAITGIKPKKFTKALSGLIGVIGKALQSTSKIDTDTLSDKISKTVNGVADSGQLAGLAKGITQLFLSLSKLLVDTATKIDWGKIAAEILTGISDAIKKDPKGARKLALGIVAIFGATTFLNTLKSKLTGKALSGVGNIITKALGDSLSIGKGAKGLGGKIAGEAGGTGLFTGLLGSAIASIGVTGTAINLQKDVKRATKKENFFKNKPKGLKANFKSDSVDTLRDKVTAMYADYATIGSAKNIKSVEKFRDSLVKLGYTDTKKLDALSSSIKKYKNISVFHPFKKNDAFNDVFKNLDKIGLDLGKTTRYLTDLDNTSLDKLRNSFDKASKSSSKLSDSSKKVYRDNKKNLKDTIKDSVDFSNKLTSLYTNTKKGVGKSASSAGKSSANKFISSAKGVLSKDTKVTAGATTLIATAGKKAKDEAKTRGNKVGSSLVSSTKSAISSDTKIKSTLSGKITSAGDSAKKVGDKKGKSIGSGITKEAATAIKGNTSIASNLKSKVSSATSDSNTKAKDKGASAGRGIVKGVKKGVEDKSLWSSIKSKISTLCKNIGTWFKNLLPDFSKLIPKPKDITEKANKPSATPKPKRTKSGTTAGASTNLRNTAIYFSSSPRPKKKGAAPSGLETALNNVEEGLTKKSSSIPYIVADSIDNNEEIAYNTIERFSENLVSKFNPDINYDDDIQGITKYSDMLSKVTEQLNSITANKVNAENFNVNLLSQPKFKQNELNAILAQNSSNDMIERKLSSLSSSMNSPSQSRPMNVSVYLDSSRKLESFIIDTVNGRVIKGGNF